MTGRRTRERRGLVFGPELFAQSGEGVGRFQFHAVTANGDFTNVWLER